MLGLLVYGNIWPKKFRQKLNRMENEMNRIKGSVTGIEQAGSLVRVWVASPTGDSSDNYIYDMPCLDESQAKGIANLWREVWGLVSTETDMCLIGCGNETEHEGFPCDECTEAMPMEVWVSVETPKPEAVYTVWVDSAIVTGFRGNVHEASKVASYWADRGHKDVTLMLENAEEVYGL